MRLRAVTQAGVEFVLEHFHTRYPARPLVNAKPAEIYLGTFEGRELKVYVEIGSNPPYVKTVAWTT